MQHNFSELEWLAYLEGRSDEQLTVRIHGHLADCAECAAFVRRTREWEREILVETRALGGDRFVSPERVEELLGATLERINDLRPAKLRPSGAILLLRRLLEPLLGRRAAQAFIELALRRSFLSVADDLEPQAWLLFVEQLRLAAGTLGGANTERMIARAGARMAAEMI